MFKIQTLNSIATIGLNEFPRELYEVSPELTHPDAILVRSQSMHDMTIPDSVKAVGRAGAGVNNIPVSELTKKGVPVFNTPGANANAVRELVIAGMLLASRNLCQAWTYVNQLSGGDADLHKNIEQNKKQFVGSELLGKTLGIVGLGSVGVKVANAAVSLGMKVVGYDPTITVNRAWELSSSVKQALSLDDLLIESDYVTVHVPLIDATRNMINGARINTTKKGVVMLNFARDGIIDEAELVKALNDGRVSTYVTDFPSALLQRHPRVISLPHLGASTKEAEENCAVMIARQMRYFLENGTITNAVNFPAVDLPYLTSGTRLAIVNANIPNMVAQISSCLAHAKINITSLINKSQNEIAYTVIDVGGDVSEAVLKQISAIEGVIQVRSLTPSK